MSSAERKKSLLDSLERSRNNTSIESNDSRRRKPSETERKNSKRSPEFDLLNIQALSRRRHSSNLTSDEVNSSLEYTEANRPDLLDSLNRRRKEKDGESELQKVALSELRRRSTESVDSEDESSSPKHSRRNWDDSDSESEEVRTLVRRSSSQLETTEAIMARQDASPDLLRAFDYVRTQFDNEYSSYSDADDEFHCVARRPACLRARICLAVAAFSVLVIVYIHLQ